MTVVHEFDITLPDGRTLHGTESALRWLADRVRG